jgi:UDP-N-acetylmuramyl pentapeptide phosphotransferase/UDP-N-acetylglucosamine-1-phosphate transferase
VRVTILLALVLGFLAARLVTMSAPELRDSPVLARTNFRGVALATASGLVVVAGVLIVEAGRSVLGAFGFGDEPGVNAARSLVLFAVFGFALLGFIDDVLGGEDRGFRGHLLALRQGRVTTGMLKLAGGAAIAFVLAAQPGFVTGKRLLADAVLIALAANLGNLLDRAPGRVLKCALVAYVPLAFIAGTGPVGIAVAPVMGAAAGVLPDDLRERSMLGDTGANLLGGVLGLMAVFTLGRGARTAVLVALVVANLASEFVSYSRVIERVPPLRWADGLGRRR